MAGFLKIDGRLTREESILDLTESTSPAETASVGKYYASSVDGKPHFKASDGTDYDLTISTASYWTRSGTTLRTSTAGDFLALGEGTLTNASYALHIDGNSTEADSTIALFRHYTTGTSAALRFFSSGGSYASPTAVGDTHRIGRIDFGGYDGDSYETAARIEGEATELWSNTQRGCDLHLYTTPDGSITRTKVLSVLNDGSLSLQQASAPSTTTDRLYNVSGDVFWDGVQLNTGPTRVDNTDVDQPSEVIDSFADTTCTACFWHYVISKGSNYRSGLINACWNATTNEVKYRRLSTDDLGDTSDVVLSVDISSDNVRLIATVASDDWSVRTKRFFVDD